MKYIDADLLRKDIDTWEKAVADDIGEYSDGVRFILRHLTFLLDSLQQEQQEVDLEKEITRFLSNATKMNKGEWRGKYAISEIGFRAVARHFYQLGKNSK